MADPITDVRDLDLLLGTPQNVKLGGKFYKLPADCSAELYLQMVQYSKLVGEEVDADVEAQLIQDLRDGLIELFQVHQPEMNRLPAAMSLQLLVEAIGRLYGPEEDPTPPPEEGPEGAGTKTRSSTRKSTGSGGRSRSSKSSRS